jgi:soluble lytic murein transglycosylase-like protein
LFFRRLTRRATGRAISVLFAGVLGLSAGFGISDSAKAEEIAALPALGPLGGSELPEVLSVADVSLYREIFELQEAGKWQAADKQIARLVDKRLMGHVLAQRYMHPTAYRSKYTELKAWLDKYADHPEAARVYKLAVKRRPKNYKWPRKPVSHRSPYIIAIDPPRDDYVSTKRLSRSDRRRASRLKWQVRRNVMRTRLTVTEELLASRDAKRLLDQVEIDEQLTEVAAGWYYFGKVQRAYGIAGPAGLRSGHKAPFAHWIAGLAAWRLGKLEEAAEHFERLALAERNISDWNSAAGAYWAARANLRLRNPEEMSRWLSLAARSPRTFYGLLARRALGMPIRFDFRPHEISPAGIQALLSTPESSRALALLQVGERQRAESELLRLRNWNEPEAAEALLGLAEHAKLPALSFKLASRLADTAPDGHRSLGEDRLEAALYPIPPWQPNGGFQVDRALVYALMRQESAFNPMAKSGDGARGLMQLMPATAGFVARKRFRGSGRNALFDPGLNMDLGQRYIAHLLSNEVVGGDLFRLTTAYNGGPGNLQKWQRGMDYDNDPLLFIESLPSRETRLFIERVLTNFWIYRARLGQPSPSLDAAASGDWPGYAALDGASREVARREPY